MIHITWFYSKKASTICQNILYERINFNYIKHPFFKLNIFTEWEIFSCLLTF